MLQIEIDRTVYNLPNEWEDITMRQLLSSQELIKEMPKLLYRHTFPKKNQKKLPKIRLDNLEVWAFYLKWFEHFVKVPNAKLIRREDLKATYDILTFFMTTPNEELPFDEHIKFKGTEYHLPESEELANGTIKHMTNSTYEDFVEGVQLTSQLARMKEGDLTVLPVLTATFYRPRHRSIKNFMRATVEPYDEDKVKKRAELFLDLPMSHVWGAYFFLCKHLEQYSNGLKTSLRDKVLQNRTLKGMAGTS